MIYIHYIYIILHTYLKLFGFEFSAKYHLCDQSLINNKIASCMMKSAFK